jgi:hypothetical protein
MVTNNIVILFCHQRSPAVRENSSILSPSPEKKCPTFLWVIGFLLHSVVDLETQVSDDELLLKAPKSGLQESLASKMDMA